MTENKQEPISMGKIILYMLLVGVVTGMLLGGLGSVLGLSSGGATAGVGASVGVVGALLLSRRKTEMDAQNK